MPEIDIAGNKMNDKYRNVLSTIGPGLLFAGAAIGGSHLIQSTRAGASYNFDLLIIVFLSNLIKYPFFEFGHRYVAATGESLIDGYKKMGNWAVWLFLVFNIFLAVINTAAVTIVTAGLFGNLLNDFFAIQYSVELLTAIILIATMLLIFFGKYKLLDTLIKYLIVVLSLFTVIAFIMAAFKGSNAPPDFIKPEIFDKAGIAFLIALMGWMPAPIEASVWSSIWTKEKTLQTGRKPSMKEVLIDFHVGYIITTVLALLFLGLGAFVMYGSGETFSNSGVAFSAQLVKLYTISLGSFMKPIIATIALITMVSTTLTVLDGYPRSLEESINILFDRKSKNNVLFWFWVVFSVIGAFLIIFVLENTMTKLLDIATAVTFLIAPIFAAVNFKLVMSKHLPNEARPPKWLVILSWIGIIFLSGFSIIYIVSRFQ